MQSAYIKSLASSALTANRPRFRRRRELLRAWGRNCVPTKAFVVTGLVVELMAYGAAARAQSIEPRSYSNAPVGVNFLAGGYAYTRGGLAFDTAVPVTDENLATSSAVVGYARTLDLWGMPGGAVVGLLNAIRGAISAFSDVNVSGVTSEPTFQFERSSS